MLWVSWVRGITIREFLDQSQAKDQEMSLMKDWWKKEVSNRGDILICEIKGRLSFTGHLIAASPFLESEFQEYKIFPDEALKETLIGYPFLDWKWLHTELSDVYSSESFSTLIGALPLLYFISENSLIVTFSNVQNSRVSTHSLFSHLELFNAHSVFSSYIE